MPWQMSHHLLFVMDWADTPHMCAFFLWCGFCHFQFESAAEIFAGQRSWLSGRQPIGPHASSSSFFPPLPSPVHTFSSLSLFFPSRFCEESREERQIRLPPQKLPITAWQRVQHCCLANAEFVNPGSTAANTWAQFWACHFKWVKRRGVAIYRHSSGIWNKLRCGCSWFFFFFYNTEDSLHLKWVRSQGIHHWQRSTPDLYWLTIPQYIYI